MTNASDVIEHYGRDDLTERLRAALDAAGLGDRLLTPEELAPLDHFHSRGLAATQELAAALAPARDAQVLDLGSGIGGPARYLAATYGCHVTGIDLSPAFVAAANYLAERSGLAGKATFECADALALPFADASFDLVWTQHVAMNIADRPRLYAEAHRVLKPGGRFAIYDIVAGETGPLHFPVPWSRGPQTSFLLRPAAMREMLEAQGFRVLAWEDQTAEGTAFFAEWQKVLAAPPAARPALNVTVVMGPEFPTMAANLARNFREGRVGLVEAILARV
ncbi:MAG: class I SAM-dependent methyltransferase [Methylovirgula sp.]